MEKTVTQNTRKTFHFQSVTVATILLGLKKAVVIVDDIVQAIGITLVVSKCYGFKKFCQYTKYNLGVS